MSKTYTLDLTAEELEILATRADGHTVPDEKVRKLHAKARADRERNDLRLPWRAKLASAIGDYNAPTRATWVVVDEPQRGGGQIIYRTEAAARLMSAAPELLEAVQLVKEQWLRDPAGKAPVVATAIERALRKVETGEPE